MSSSFDDVVSRLASQSDAIGRLAQDSGGFSAVVAAFESKDASAFRWVLDRLEMSLLRIDLRVGADQTLRVAMRGGLRPAARGGSGPQPRGIRARCGASLIE